VPRRRGPSPNYQALRRSFSLNAMSRRLASFGSLRATVGAALGLGGADDAGCCTGGGGGLSWSLKSRSADAQPTQAQASTKTAGMRIALSWRQLGGRLCWRGARPIIISERIESHNSHKRNYGLQLGRAVSWRERRRAALNQGRPSSCFEGRRASATNRPAA
jgi:hypothetical protein